MKIYLISKMLFPLAHLGVDVIHLGLFVVSNVIKALLYNRDGFHGGRDDLILSAKLIRIAPETSSF